MVFEGAKPTSACRLPVRTPGSRRRRSTAATRAIRGQASAASTRPARTRSCASSTLRNNMTGTIVVTAAPGGTPTPTAPTATATPDATATPGPPAAATATPAATVAPTPAPQAKPTASLDKPKTTKLKTFVKSGLKVSGKCAGGRLGQGHARALEGERQEAQAQGHDARHRHHEVHRWQARDHAQADVRGQEGAQTSEEGAEHLAHPDGGQREVHGQGHLEVANSQSSITSVSYVGPHEQWGSTVPGGRPPRRARGRDQHA